MRWHPVPRFRGRSAGRRVIARRRSPIRAVTGRQAVREILKMRSALIGRAAHGRAGRSTAKWRAGMWRGRLGAACPVWQVGEGTKSRGTRRGSAGRDHRGSASGDADDGSETVGGPGGVRGCPDSNRHRCRRAPLGWKSRVAAGGGAERGSDVRDQDDERQEVTASVVGPVLCPPIHCASAMSHNDVRNNTGTHPVKQNRCPTARLPVERGTR